MPSEKTIDQCTITLTRGCNLRCSFCYAQDTGYMSKNQIDYCNLKKAVDFCIEAKVKYIVFTGGEPLLYPRFTDILQYIKDMQHPIMVALATNGVLLESTALCKGLIDNGIKYIDLSLKGKDSKEWYKTAGYDGSTQQLQAIRNLSLLPVEFTCSMVITPENVSTFCDAVQIAYDNGAKQFSFTFVIDNENSEKKEQAYLKNHNPFDLLKAFFTHIDRLNSITKEWWIEYSFPYCVYTKEQLLLLKGKLAAPCQVHTKNAVTFDTKLELLPCNMYINQKMGRLGTDFNSYEQFKDWTNQPLYRNTMTPLRESPSSECAYCQHLESCYGGCPVLWKNYSFGALKAFKKDNDMAK